MANNVQGQGQKPASGMSTGMVGAGAGANAGTGLEPPVEKKSLWSRWWVWFIIVLILIVVGVGIWFWLT